MKQLLLLLASFAATFNYASAQFEPDGDFNPFGGEKPNITLTPESITIAPGIPFKVVIKLDHPEGWHSYYINPGFLGNVLKLDWTLPEGFVAGPIQWQTPSLGHTPEAIGYEYEGSAAHIVSITPPENLKTGETLSFSVSAKWQICDPSGCQDKKGSASFELKSGSSPAPSAESADLIKSTEELQPIRDHSWGIEVFEQGSNYVIRLTPGKNAVEELKDVYFFSSDMQTSGAGGQKLIHEEGSYTLQVGKAINDALDNPIKRLPHLSGIIRAESGWIKGDNRRGLEFSEIPITKKPLESAGIGKFLGILGGMLLGGLILNLMPCVFPVIGLKIMGFAQQAGEAKSKIVIHGLTFAAGVLASFWVLSGVLLTLRNAALKGDGEEVGWGYQLQNPYIVLTILLLMFILALNMFGVFEIGTKATGVGSDLQNKHGFTGSFFSGVLATIVATPCSAPFLGAAIGAAFALPNFQFMLAFTAMALGLALPYLILSIFPHLVEKLPRPGAWMESFKQAMSFLLFATAGYLLWVYTSQTGLDYMFNIIIGLSSIALALWIYGRWNLPHKTTKVKSIAKILTVVGLVGGIFICLPPDKSQKLTWEKWSEDKVEQLLEDDTPIYVDFTATWCATCQLNKQRAYPPEIVELFKEYGVVALKGDKTNASPDIEKKLQELGRTAIPVNVLYIPGKDEPIITPEILSADYMRELITQNLKKPQKE